MFQFHSGSIKFLHLRFFLFLHRTFQFHSGSIKFQFGFFVFVVTNQRFNSILVQLNYEQRPTYQETAARFQFHSGSIKLQVDIGTDAAWVASFQFHSGSIKFCADFRYFGKTAKQFQFHSGSIKFGTSRKAYQM